MKHLFGSIAGAGLLLFSLAGQVAAQSDDWQRLRNEFFRGNDWRMHLFERVRTDLDHVQADSFKRSDRGRIERTKTELADLQGKLAAHDYDQRELDDVIGSMQRVVTENRMDTHDRDMLGDDLARMRDYRDHHENWR